MDFPAIWGYLQQLQQPGLVSPVMVEELHPLLVMPAALHSMEFLASIPRGMASPLLPRTLMVHHRGILTPYGLDGCPSSSDPTPTIEQSGQLNRLKGIVSRISRMKQQTGGKYATTSACHSWELCSHTEAAPFPKGPRVMESHLCQTTNKLLPKPLCNGPEGLVILRAQQSRWTTWTTDGPLPVPHVSRARPRADVVVRLCWC